MITSEDYTIEGECWLWKWGRNSRGYGKMRDGRSIVLVHRYMYEQEVGEIPIGDQVRHLCGSKLCVNPEHLATGDQSDNEADKEAHGTNRRYFQYCKRSKGRPLTKEDA